MINEYICYKCYCDKCNHSWIIMPETFPKMCPKCKTKKWNDKSLGSAQVSVETVDETPDEQGEIPMTMAEKVQNLRDLIAPIKTGVVTKVIPEVDQWIGWTDEQIERQDGQKITFRVHIKSKRVREIRRESDLDSFA